MFGLIQAPCLLVQMVSSYKPRLVVLWNFFFVISLSPLAPTIFPPTL